MSSASRRFQPGEGPSRGLLRDFTTSPINRFAALVSSEAVNIMTTHYRGQHLTAALRSVLAPGAPAPEVPAHAAEKIRLDTTQSMARARARSGVSLQRLPPLPGAVHGRHVVAQQLLPVGDGRGGATLHRVAVP